MSGSEGSPNRFCGYFHLFHFQSGYFTCKLLFHLQTVISEQIECFRDSLLSTPIIIIIQRFYISHEFLDSFSCGNFFFSLIRTIVICIIYSFTALYFKSHQPLQSLQLLRIPKFSSAFLAFWGPVFLAKP